MMSRSELEMRTGPGADGRAPRGAPAGLSPGRPMTGSSCRAWCYLVALSFRRQARMRQMVWIALCLMGFSVVLVGLFTAGGEWSMARWRQPKPPRMSVEDWRKLPNYSQAVEEMALVRMIGPWPAPAAALQDGVSASCRVVLDRSGFFVFSRWWVFWIFLSFLLPICSLSFSTDAIGGEREGNGLMWLLTRPLPRASIYLAKFVALLPWSVGLSLAGFALFCLPAVVLGSLAFASLFFFIGAFFRRPAIVALVYSFFLETILGNLPGYMKRVSISFYARCMMFDVAQEYGLEPERPSVYLPVDGTTAWGVLLAVTVLLLLLGMFLFSRKEYAEAAV